MPEPGKRGHDLTVTSRPVALDSPDVADAVAQAVHVAFGVVSLGLGVALRTLESTPPVPRQPGPRLPVSDVADLVVGAAWGATRLSGKIATTGARVTAPIVSLTLRPPGVPRRLQPAHGMALVVARWQRDRPDTVRTFTQWSATALPGAMDAALGQLDVHRLVSEVLDRVDVDRVVAEILRRIDLDALVALALARLDVAALVSATLDRLDVTGLVLERVDLERVVDEALQKVDLTQVVMEQVDLIDVAEYVVAGIDLPEIIRASTGSVASEAVRGLRMQGVDADLAVARVVDRMLFRRRHGREPGAADLQPPDDGIASGRLT